MGVVRRREQLGRLEQRLAGARAGLIVEPVRGGRDRLLQGELRGVLGRERGQLGGEVGSVGRESREHRGLLVEEVPGHRALEVAQRVLDAVVVVGIGAAGGEPARGLEQDCQDLVVAAVGPLELGEAGELHGPARIPRRSCGHKRSPAFTRRALAC